MKSKKVLRKQNFKMVEKPLYIGLDSPVEFRKRILLCTKDMLHALKSYEYYKALRLKKESKMSDFRHALQEVNTLNNKLKRLFPKIKLKECKSEAPAQPPEHEAIPQKSKLEMLEEQLDLIESTIEKLG